MPDSGVLLASLERFATTLTGGHGIGAVLHNLTGEMAEVLDLTGAGLTWDPDGPQRFVTATVDAIAFLGRVQESRQKGPCIDAVASAVTVTVPDLADEDTHARWPHYAIAARTAGMQAVAAVPMLSEGRAIGAVCLYDRQPRTWSAEDLRVATTFASIATCYLVHASARQEHQRIAEQQEQALSTRLVIEQAKGVLATKRDITVDDAFHTLRKYARDNRVRIQDVSRAVVRGELVP